MYELNKQLNNSTFIIVLAIFVTNISFAVLAHDTKVTHPVITLEAIRLLEKQDKNYVGHPSLYDTKLRRTPISLQTNPFQLILIVRTGLF